MTSARTIFDGAPLQGWTSFRVRSSIDEIADSWSVSISTKRTGPRSDLELVRRGMTSTIEVGGERLITGYVERVERSKSATSRSLSVSGRSAAGDLVDCSVVGRSTFRKETVGQIAGALCKPYGIAASVEIDGLDPLPRFRAQSGEEVFAALKRLGEEVGGRWVSARYGGIRLVRIDALSARRARKVIAAGRNVVEMQSEETGDARFSDYVFRTQLSPSDNLNGDDASNVETALCDPGVDRYRPRVVQVDSQGGLKALQRQAAWERTTRAGASVSCRYTIIDPRDPWESWYGSPGVLWSPGMFVSVQDDDEGCTGTWVVRVVELARTMDRISAVLELAHPDALTLQEPRTRKRGSLL